MRSGPGSEPADQRSVWEGVGRVNCTEPSLGLHGRQLGGRSPVDMSAIPVRRNLGERAGMNGVDGRRALVLGSVL